MEKSYREEYRISNEARIERTDIPLECKRYARKIWNGHYEYAQYLADCLSEWYEIYSAEVDLLEERRPPVGEKNGYGCYFIGKGLIDIYMLTYTGKEIGPKAFIETLIEEWMHHYDYEYLGLTRAIHSRGFRERIKQILRLLEIRRR